jgi:hypothetical protein
MNPRYPKTGGGNMEIKKTIPTFPPPRLLLLHSPRTKRKRSLPKHDYSPSFRLILRLEKTGHSLPTQDESFMTVPVTRRDENGGGPE